MAGAESSLFEDLLRSGGSMPVPIAAPLVAAAPASPPALGQPASVAVAPPAAGDLFADVFGKKSTRVAAAPAAQPPRIPVTIAETGLTLGMISEMVLKLLYVQGSLIGQEIAQNCRLMFPIVDESLRFLKDQRCLEISGGDVVGRVSYRFALTELGRLRAREVFDQCRYVGPAPVPLEQYIQQVRKQTVSGIPCTPEALRAAFEDYIIRPGLLGEVGPAVCAGQSMFVYGPPGNGKTVLAKGLGRFLNSFGGEIYVPYALQAENTIITLFDPVLHQTTDDAELSRKGIGGPPGTEAGGSQARWAVVGDTQADQRYRRIRRPVIITGGELTLEMLELQFNRAANFYNAPLHIKANGGVFLIDDFGRQLVSPKDLLNRWIVPLEERLDYLTLSSGRKFAIPFEQLIIFSTNLEPKDLVDDAFLRRIRHKVRIDPPSREMYTKIFELVCRQRGVAFSPQAVEWLFKEYYDKGRMPRSSDPRDIVDMAQATCRFEGIPVEWSPDLTMSVAHRLFHAL